MLTHHNDHRRDIRTLTTSRLIDATPRHLAQALQHQNLFRPPAADPQRPLSVVLELDPTPDGHGAVTLYGPHGGISERRPLRTQHASTARLTVVTWNDAFIRNASETPAFALTIDLTPLVRPGPTIATRMTLSFHFVREPWWPHDLTEALGGLANLWLQRLKEQTHTRAKSYQTTVRDGNTQAAPSTFSRRSKACQVSETWHV